MTALGRLRTGLRWLLLAQLAVGLLFQPVLGLASELHVHTSDGCRPWAGSGSTGT
jgi:hypothetical protein